MFFRRSALNVIVFIIFFIAHQLPWASGANNLGTPISCEKALDYDRIQFLEYIRSQLPKNGIKLDFAVESDVIETTELIKSAYQVWHDSGLDLPQSRQTTHETRKHLIGSGITVRNLDDQIICTISIDLASLQFDNSGTFFKLVLPNKGREIEYVQRANFERTSSGNYSGIYISKFAVLPGQSNRGLGRILLKLIEQAFSNQKYKLLLLETSPDALWLYSWYLRSGFESIGDRDYPEINLKTVLMLKGI